MGEPQTFTPKIIPPGDGEVFSIHVETEGMLIAFDIDAHQMQNFIDDLEFALAEYLREEKPHD